MEQLPIESPSQEIGQHAVMAFTSNHPLNWRSTATDGDSDAGLDFQVQVVQSKVYAGLFHAQIKGSRQSKNDSCSLLDSKSEYFSISLSTRTLNYYLKIESPVMLVFVDLTSDKNPRKCKIYYNWIDDELNKLLGDNDNFDYLGKKSISFKIPVSNVLSSDLNVMPYLIERQKRKSVFKSLYKEIEKATEEPLKAVSTIKNRISQSKVILETLIEETEDFWLEAPKDSFAYMLKQSKEKLSYNFLPQAFSILSSLKKRLSDASNHEKAEYYRQYGLYYSYLGDHYKARDFFKKAWNTYRNKKTYHISYLESELYFIQNNIEKCEKFLAEIINEDEIEYVHLKVKLLCLLKRFDEALGFISEHSYKDVLIIKPITLLLKKDYDSLIDSCNKSLSHDGLNDKQKLTLFSLRARGYFNLSLGEKIRSMTENTLIPFSGYPDMDRGVLRRAYEDLVNAFQIGKSLNYPADIEHFLDIASIVFFYFNDGKFFLKILKKFCEIHSSAVFPKEVLLETAQKLEDYETIIDVLKDLPDSPENVIHRIIAEYHNKDAIKVVDIMNENWEVLKEKQPRNFGISLGVAAQCATELMLINERDKFLDAIHDLDNSENILAVYDYIVSINENVLNREEAAEIFYSKFEKNLLDSLSLSQLFDALIPKDKNSSQKIVNVADKIRKERDLDFEEYSKLLHSHTLIGNWQTIIEEVKQLQLRFGDHPRLISYKALALDELGDTSTALNELSNLINQDHFDSNAFELYVNICLRCGMFDTALKYINELLAKSNKSSDKIELLRQLFNLEHRKNRQNPRLINICKRLGKIVDKENETEEGIFLSLFLIATLEKDISVDDQFISEAKSRINKFIVNFPNSKILGVVNFNPESENILEKLESALGLSQERKDWYEKCKNQLINGNLTVPYVMRHHFLLSISSTMQLWETSKILGLKEKHLTLHILTDDIDPKYSNHKIKNRIALIDTISMLILSDLDINAALLEVFNRIAISKDTIYKLLEWSENPIFYQNDNPAKKSIEFIRNNVDRIYQPSIKNLSKKENNIFDYLDNQKRIVGKYNYIYYSDDAFSRVYLFGTNYKDMSLCTIDLLENLRTECNYEDSLIAGKYAKLCSFNIDGIVKSLSA